MYFSHKANYFLQLMLKSLIPPLRRGCDLCASLVRPHHWPGRRWRQKGGRTVVLVVQGCYTGRSDIAMDATVIVKFWACSKQSHKCRRGGRSLTGRSKEAGGRHTHRRGRRMDARWLAIGRPINKCVLLWTVCINLSDASAFLVPPLCLLWPTSSVHWEITVATTVPLFGDHGNPWATLAMVLPPLWLLSGTWYGHYNSFGRSRKAQGSCCSSYTETELSDFGRPLSVLTIFLVAQRWHEGRSPV